MLTKDLKFINIVIAVKLGDGTMRLILLGPPGSRGTQAVFIAAKYEYPHISTGDIFRDNVKQGTELSRKQGLYG